MDHAVYSGVENQVRIGFCIEFDSLILDWGVTPGQQSTGLHIHFFGEPAEFENLHTRFFR